MFNLKSNIFLPRVHFQEPLKEPCPVCTMIFSCNLWLPQWFLITSRYKTENRTNILLNFEKCCGGMDICFCTFDIKLEDILMKVKSQERWWFPDKSHQWMAKNLIRNLSISTPPAAHMWSGFCIKEVFRVSCKLSSISIVVFPKSCHAFD